MKTEQLIDVLVADNATPQARFPLIYAASLIVAIGVAALIFFASIGVRPDLAAAATSPWVWLKIGVNLALAATSAKLLPRLGEPGQSMGVWGLALLIGPVVLAAGVGAELAMSPASSWWPKLVGTHAKYCLMLIPMLSAGPLACLFFALREGAPTNAGAAGAAAGLLASSMGATLYAFHCTDDSLLFVAVWYSIAIALIVAAGYALGPRLLRW